MPGIDVAFPMERKKIQVAKTPSRLVLACNVVFVLIEPICLVHILWSCIAKHVSLQVGPEFTQLGPSLYSPVQYEDPLVK